MSGTMLLDTNSVGAAERRGGRRVAAVAVVLAALLAAAVLVAVLVAGDRGSATPATTDGATAEIVPCHVGAPC